MLKNNTFHTDSSSSYDQTKRYEDLTKLVGQDFALEDQKEKPYFNSIYLTETPLSCQKMLICDVKKLLPMNEQVFEQRGAVLFKKKWLFLKFINIIYVVFLLIKKKIINYNQ